MGVYSILLPHPKLHSVRPVDFRSIWLKTVRRIQRCGWLQADRALLKNLFPSSRLRGLLLIWVVLYTNGIIGHPLPETLVPVRAIKQMASKRALDELGRSLSPFART